MPKSSSHLSKLSNNGSSQKKNKTKLFEGSIVCVKRQKIKLSIVLLKRQIHNTTLLQYNNVFLLLPSTGYVVNVTFFALLLL
jgi:hypothetical protein